jgi:hypothetical protein
MFLPDFALHVIHSTSKYLDATLKDTGLVADTTQQDDRIRKIAQPLFNSISIPDQRPSFRSEPILIRREEKIFFEDPTEFSELSMPDNGSCLFYSIHYWLGQYKAYLVANKLLNGSKNEIPNAVQLRIQALEYIKKHYDTDIELQKIVDFSIQDYNESARHHFKILLMNFASLLEEVPDSLKNDSYFHIRGKLSEIIENDHSESISELKLSLDIYAEELKQKDGAAEAIILMNALSHTLLSNQPINLKTYLELYQKPDFFGNRDAIYALSQIYRIDFNIYQKVAGDSSSLLQPGEPRILTSCSSNDISNLLDQKAPLAFIVYRGKNHYNVLD